jgi:hypothetical protein
MKGTTIYMAAILAAATVLVAGLAVLPESLQNAQANPCAAEWNSAPVESHCVFSGFVEIEEEEE